MVNADSDSSGSENPLEHALRSINPRRRRLSDDQVNRIREGYLLDGKSLAQLREELPEELRISRVAIWRCAQGRAYGDVPLTERLIAAHQHARARRELSAAQIAELSGRAPAAAHAEPAGEAADELFEPEAASDPAEDWA
jgi:hypothetical protein